MHGYPVQNRFFCNLQNDRHVYSIYLNLLYNWYVPFHPFPSFLGVHILIGVSKNQVYILTCSKLQWFIIIFCINIIIYINIPHQWALGPYSGGMIFKNWLGSSEPCRNNFQSHPTAATALPSVSVGPPPGSHLAPVQPLAPHIRASSRCASSPQRSPGRVAWRQNHPWRQTELEWPGWWYWDGQILRFFWLMLFHEIWWNMMKYVRSS